MDSEISVISVISIFAALNTVKNLINSNTFHQDLSISVLQIISTKYLQIQLSSITKQCWQKFLKQLYQFLSQTGQMKNYISARIQNIIYPKRFKNCNSKQQIFKLIQQQYHFSQDQLKEMSKISQNTISNKGKEIFNQILKQIKELKKQNCSNIFCEYELKLRKDGHKALEILNDKSEQIQSKKNKIDCLIYTCTKFQVCKTLIKVSSQMKFTLKDQIIQCQCLHPRQKYNQSREECSTIHYINTSRGTFQTTLVANHQQCKTYLILLNKIYSKVDKARNLQKLQKGINTIIDFKISQQQQHSGKTIQATFDYCSQIGDKLDFETLRKQLEQSGGIIKLTWQISSSIQFLEKYGIYHNDIKPSNIIKNKSNGCYEIIDLNSAIIYHKDLSQDQPTNQQSIKFWKYLWKNKDSMHPLNSHLQHLEQFFALTGCQEDIFIMQMKRSLDKRNPMLLGLMLLKLIFPQLYNNIIDKLQQKKQQPLKILNDHQQFTINKKECLFHMNKFQADFEFKKLVAKMIDIRQESKITMSQINTEIQRIYIMREQESENYMNQEFPSLNN